jgi:hypothetical protein
MQQIPDYLVPLSFLDTRTNTVVGAEGVTLTLGTAGCNSSPEPTRAKRPPSRGKISVLTDMPYYGTLPSAMAFTKVILDGGDENAIFGHHKLEEAEYIRLYNHNPVGWFEAASFADKLKGYMKPSAAVALYVIAHRLNHEKAQLFTNALKALDQTIATDLLVELMEIDGEGKRVEQLRTALIAFRSFAELKKARPIFPHLIRK